MLILPKTIMPLVSPFRPIFNKSTWLKAQVLMVGAILSPGKRTVTAALRVMGLSQEGQFAKYHHVLNRAAWPFVSIIGETASTTNLVYNTPKESRRCLTSNLSKSVITEH